MINKNILSLDTVRAFCDHIYLDTNDLVHNKNWIMWKDSKKNNTTFNKTEGNLRFYYDPCNNYLELKFSASKVINGSNAIPFNFSDTNLLKQYINIIINTVLPENHATPSFDEWSINEMHTHVDYLFSNKTDAMAYQDCIAKTRFKRCTNTIYGTGNQARNNSYSYNIYLKEEQIKNNLINKPKKVNEIDKHILVKNRNKFTLRFETQAKKLILHELFGKKRKVKDILNLNSCKLIFDHFIVKNGFHNPFLRKDNLINKIEKSFNPSQGKTVKKVIQTYNDIGLDEAKKIRKESTIISYIRNLNSKGINPIYLPNKVKETIDFTKYITTDTCQIIVRVIKYILEKLQISIGVYSKSLNYTIRVQSLILYIHDSYYYEEGG